MKIKCENCRSEIDTGRLEVHKKKFVECKKCKSRYSVMKHGDDKLDIEVLEW